MANLPTWVPIDEPENHGNNTSKHTQLEELEQMIRNEELKQQIDRMRRTRRTNLHDTNPASNRNDESDRERDRRIVQQSLKRQEESASREQGENDQRLRAFDTMVEKKKEHNKKMKKIVQAALHAHNVKKN